MLKIKRFATCETCKFWNNEHSRYGPHECRRHAPDARDKEHRWREGTWPETKANDWCGDYQGAILVETEEQE